MYFDTAYVAKCYVREPGSDHVRKLAAGAASISCCEWARLEFVCAVKRHIKTDRLTARRGGEILAAFENDVAGGFWNLLPVSSTLVMEAGRLMTDAPHEIHAPSGDALHMACARANGFREIYSNDQHILTAAPFFGLKAVNVIPKD